ncbi:hypothetical protein A7S98_22645 [Salmonella enterica subsp. enterica serovar Braenderup]|nr:RHS repeat-associated core domain-containing protein [Salmonella enterica]OHL30561.1 hypothetical protein A7S98_22645 [Salmonella enterica subsp. enterica serovar Braenderup]
MALSASEKRYADGSPALREQWHYRGGFELLAKEARAANDDTSDFYPILIGPDGAPQEMYSANGRKVWRRQRSLWGLAAANDASPDARESCDAGFMGQWQDEESGLWYNLHRYMDSRTGQYLSQDPLKLGGGLNTQSYVHDPVGWCDPVGLKGCILKEVDNEDYDFELRISKKEYPETAQHIEDAINSGKADVVTIDRDNSAANRAKSLKGIPTKPGKDRDEWPMAMFKEGGTGADVEYISPSDNRGAGSSIGHALDGVRNGAKLKIIIVD